MGWAAPAGASPSAEVKSATRRHINDKVGPSRFFPPNNMGTQTRMKDQASDIAKLRSEMEAMKINNQKIQENGFTTINRRGE